jgi:hypothetical protein
MKIYIYLLITFLFSTITLCAQITREDSLVFNGNKVLRNQTLYNNIENPIEISDLSKNSILKIEGNAVLKKSENKYRILPKKTGLIKLFEIKGQKKKLLKTFSVIELEEPLFSVGGVSEGKMPSAIFRNQLNIIGELRNTFLEEAPKVQVIQYIMILTGKGYEEANFWSGHGNSLPADGIVYKNMQPGTVITIADIIYTINSGEKRYVAKKSIMLTLY